MAYLSAYQNCAGYVRSKQHLTTLKLTATSRELIMLECLSTNHKTPLRCHVNKIIYAYNSTTNSATGYLPYYLLFGMSSRLPIVVLLPSHNSHQQSYSELVKKWKGQIKKAYLITQKHSDKRQKKDLRRYDKHISSLATLKPGFKVLVSNLSQRGRRTGKLRNPWEERLQKSLQEMQQQEIQQ